MSLLSIATPLSPALPANTTHPHGHGHRRGSVDTQDSSASTTASASTPTSQLPTGSTQSLFGSLLTSLEQTIGLKPAGSIIDTKA